MVKTDFVTELEVILVREKVTVTEATKDVCTRQTWYRALANKTVIPKCIVEVLDKLGYDIEIKFIKKED